eukprot:UN03627
MNHIEKNKRLIFNDNKELKNLIDRETNNDIKFCYRSVHDLQSWEPESFDIVIDFNFGAYYKKIYGHTSYDLWQGLHHILHGGKTSGDYCLFGFNGNVKRIFDYGFRESKKCLFQKT